MKKRVLGYAFWWPLAASLCLLGGLFFWQYGLLIEATGGLFSYVLDDAYIHLALSENIMKGHYGVNLQEYSAPSSSILWSFLMAPVAHWQLAPLIFNVLLSCLALLVWHIQIQRLFPSQRFAPLLFAFNLSFIAFANLIGVSFTGMENLLQMVIAMGILAGTVQIIEGKEPKLWLFALIIIAPLARYETISVSGLSLVILAFSGHFRKAVITGLLMLVPLVSFSLYLDSLGLGYLPSSINSKSSAMQSSALISIALNFYRNLYESTGSLMLALLLPILWRALSVFKQKPLLTVLAVMVSGVVVAHLALASLGNWGRYEVYIWVVLLFSLIYVFQDTIQHWYQSPTFPKTFAYIALVCFTVIGAKRALVTSVTNPVGGANIALQQMQMHIFATEYWNKPIAVNDLGWVAYQNDEYVLDVWGLANAQALELRKAKTPDFLNILTKQHGVDLAIIYKEWFSNTLRQNWTLVGTLHFPDDLRRMTSAIRSVQFYATHQYAVRPDIVQDIKSKMQAFETQLPKGAYFTFE